MNKPTATGPAIVLAGSVGSSLRTLKALLRNHMRVVGVLGLSPAKNANVSGYARLDDVARNAGIPYAEFEDINRPETVARIRKWAPDVLFVVGLSQMVKPDLLAVPRLGCVGYHPTRLPEGRGRAPLAWLTLQGRSGASTFYQMDAGADSGPLLAQEPFAVRGSDYAADVVRKLEDAIDVALDRWLPRLRVGEWNPKPQNHARATYYGKRAPEDGVIHWSQPARKILALVRASSRPHPGAYTTLGDRKLTIWRAEIETKLRYTGVTGRILVIDEKRGALVQTGNGLLWLVETEWEAPAKGEKSVALKVGLKLGCDPAEEIRLLRKRIAELEGKLAESRRRSVPKRKKS
jgi:methionyl-tRNA formyltransferase